MRSDRDASPVDDRRTGVPLLRSWRAVYLFVGATFVGWLVLLWAIMRHFA